MIIEPQSAQPGYLKRWSLQALKLMYRTPLVLFIYLLLTIGVADLSRFCTCLNLIIGLIGTSFLMSIAKEVDKKTLGISYFIQMFPRMLKNSFLVIFQDPLTLTLFFFLMAFGTYETYHNSVLPLSLFVIIKEIADISWYGFFLHSGVRLKVFSYLLRDEYDINEPELIENLCTKAEEKNKAFSLLINQVSIINLMFFFFCPYLGVATLLFLPFFVYVAFREIFMNKLDNQKQEQTVSEAVTDIGIV